MRLFLDIHKLHDQGAGLDVHGRDMEWIPHSLRSFIADLHGRSYANGFFDFREPSLLYEALSLWDVGDQHVFPLLKLGFGHLLYYKEDGYFMIDPIYNEIQQIISDPDPSFIFDTMLTDTAVLDNAYLFNRYNAAVNSIGPVGKDEIYGFVPALRLGGSGGIEQIHKVKFIAEMMILAAL